MKFYDRENEHDNKSSTLIFLKTVMTGDDILKYSQSESQEKEDSCQCKRPGGRADK